MNTEGKRQHSSQLVPFSYYKCLIPDYFASVPLHWHGEFEIHCSSRQALRLRCCHAEQYVR